MAHIISYGECSQKNGCSTKCQDTCPYDCKGEGCLKCSNHCPCCIGSMDRNCIFCNEENCDNRTVPYDPNSNPLL